MSDVCLKWVRSMKSLSFPFLMEVICKIPLV